MSETTQVDAGNEAGTSPPPLNGQGDAETQARALGWRPREQWRGSDGRWVDAETFLNRSQGWLPMVQQRNQEMQRDLTAARAEMAEMRQVMTAQLERQRKAEAIGYKRAMRELEQRKAEAVSNADAATVTRIDQEIRDMGPDPAAEPVRQAPPPTQPTQQQADPTVVAWVQQNPWVTADPTAWDLAVSTLNRVQAAMPQAALRDQLAEVERRISRFFTDAPAGGDDAGDPPPPRQNARREQPASVSRSGSASQANRGAAPRSFEAMPAEAQRQYEKEKRALAGKGPELTRKEFAEYYWEQFEDDQAA